MATAGSAADNLMLTGTVVFCADCGDDRIFVVPECDDGGSGDYCCTECGAAVSFVVELGSPGRPAASRVA